MVKSAIRILASLALISVIAIPGTIFAEELTNAAEGQSGSLQESGMTTISAEEFDLLLQRLPVAVVNAGYLEQSEDFNYLRPNLLQATMRNQSGQDISDVTVGFLAWDKDGNPMSISAFGIVTTGLSGSFFFQGEYSDMIVRDGVEFGQDSGFMMAEQSFGIHTAKAIVISYTTVDGTTWENPYVNAWRLAYEGNPISDTVSVDSKTLEELRGMSEPEQAPTVALTQGDIASALSKMPVSVTSASYYVQSNELKALYPDMLLATYQNNTEENVRYVEVTFAAWDRNGLPIKLATILSDGYAMTVSFDGVNLVPGASSLGNQGMELADDIDWSNIATVQAIVSAYESYEGTEWDNPLYDLWAEHVAGQPLNKDATFDVDAEFAEANGLVSDADSDSSVGVGIEEFGDLVDAQLPITIDSVSCTNGTIVPGTKVIRIDFTNTSDQTITEIGFSVCLWNSNGEALPIPDAFELGGQYVVRATANGGPFEPGGQYYIEYQVDPSIDNLDVSYYDAMVYSVRYSDGTTATNPLHLQWESTFGGVSFAQLGEMEGVSIDASFVQ